MLNPQCEIGEKKENHVNARYSLLPIALECVRLTRYYPTPPHSDSQRSIIHPLSEGVIDFMNGKLVTNEMSDFMGGPFRLAHGPRLFHSAARRKMPRYCLNLDKAYICA